MDIRDLDQLELLSHANQVWGQGETIAVGYVETGDGYAFAGAYAGALGDNATTTSEAHTRTRQGRWSRLSRAEARSEAQSTTPGRSSRSSFSGRSTHFGFGGGFVQISSATRFDVS